MKITIEKFKSVVDVDAQHTLSVICQKQNEVLENGRTLLSEIKR